MRQEMSDRHLGLKSAALAEVFDFTESLHLFLPQIKCILKSGSAAPWVPYILYLDLCSLLVRLLSNPGQCFPSTLVLSPKLCHIYLRTLPPPSAHISVLWTDGVPGPHPALDPAVWAGGSPDLHLLCFLVSHCKPSPPSALLSP